MQHPYIPNSDPQTKQEMLKFIGVESIDDIFSVIPKAIQTKKSLDLPHTTSEQELRRRVESILSRNTTTRETLSFLGAGCWPHYIPAVCDEINARSEFLTAYTGDAYSDLGRYQALFEFQSMIGDLVELDAVTFPLYDWSTAAGDALRMATLVTGRHGIIVPKIINPDRLSVVGKYCGDFAETKLVEYRRTDGQVDLDDLKRKITKDTAAVYIENPSYLGFVESQCDEIARISHDNDALFVVGVEPLSLGVLAPPGEYGADIVCGEAQPFGLHMGYGGVSLGFLACRDEEEFLSATGHRLITIAGTQRKNEWGFEYVLPDRSMFAGREKSASITGTTTALWAITAAAYMALLGSKGIGDLAQAVMQKSRYAMKQLSDIRGITTPLFNAPHFEEFTVNFNRTKQSVHDVNSTLLKRGIFGGKDISREFPELGETALYCVTEVHSKDDIDQLTAVLQEATRQ